jgi:hypothetical protein
VSITRISKLSRRETLRWIALTSLIPAFPRLSQAATDSTVIFTATPRGYGTDPSLNDPVVTWQRTLEPPHLRLIATLADLILPAQESSPAPSALGVHEFVDEWVSAPYPEQKRDRGIIVDGLEWLDAEAVRRGNRNFLSLDTASQEAMVDDIARAKFDPRVAFFERIRFLVISAYYTTPEGFKDIGYTGNVPMLSYPAVTDEERLLLDSALSKLGLSHQTGSGKA